MNKVQEILDKVDKSEIKAKEAISVKNIHESSVQYDVGNLAIIDLNELDSQKLSQDGSKFINSRARDLTQLFINKIWSMERPSNDNFIDLPENQIKIPRMLEYMSKPETKWEKFAKKKGIVKKKKERLVWDDDEKKWKPRFGYRGINQKNKGMPESMDIE